MRWIARSRQPSPTASFARKWTAALERFRSLAPLASSTPRPTTTRIMLEQFDRELPAYEQYGQKARQRATARRKSFYATDSTCCPCDKPSNKRINDESRSRVESSMASAGSEGSVSRRRKNMSLRILITNAWLSGPLGIRAHACGTSRPHSSGAVAHRCRSLTRAGSLAAELWAATIPVVDDLSGNDH